MATSLIKASPAAAMPEPAHTVPAYVPDWSVSIPGRRIATTRLLKGFVLAAALLALLTWSVGTGILRDLQSGVQTIGRDTVPSVIAAEEIRAHLAAMNAQAADAMLTGGVTAQKAWQAYEAERAIVSDRLITAAQNITFGDAERSPILEITKGVQSYAELIGQVRAMVSPDPRVPTPDQAILTLRAATTLLSDKLMPAADRLNEANAAILEKTWATRKKASVREGVMLFALALPALALLIGAQWVLFRRTRRRVHPLLVLATLTVIVCSFFTAGLSGHASTQLRIAKEDAFDSANALWRARSTAYDANADESLFLADPAMKARYAQLYRAKMALIADTQIDGPAAVKALFEKMEGLVQRNCPAGAVTLKGYLGDELRNVTFKGECAAAVAAVQRLVDYQVIDGRIRALEAAGRRDEAILLDVGTRQGESNWAFDRFDQSLDALIVINRTAFEDAIDTCFRNLQPLEWMLSIECFALFLLTWLGIRPRLAEYRD